MAIRPTITYRNLAPVPWITEEINDRFDKLSQLDEIGSCEVVVETPHRRHNKGKHFHVRIRLTIPGMELVADRDPDAHDAYTDIRVALRDAFESVKRQLLEQRARRRELAVGG